MEKSWFVCLLVLSTLPNAQTHLRAGQRSLSHYGATGFVRLGVGQRSKGPKAALLALLCQGTVDLLVTCPDILSGTLNSPKMSWLGAASCSLPISLNSTDVLWLTSRPPSQKSRQECLLWFGLGLAECLSLCCESIEPANPKPLNWLASISSRDDQPKAWHWFVYV